MIVSASCRTAIPAFYASAPFIVQFTLTGYPRTLETSVIDADQAVEQLRELRRRFGARVAVWCYDPMVFAAEQRPVARYVGTPH